MERGAQVCTIHRRLFLYAALVQGMVSAKMIRGGRIHFELTAERWICSRRQRDRKTRRADAGTGGVKSVEKQKYTLDKTLIHL
jgi:hypothetical protein